MKVTIEFKKAITKLNSDEPEFVDKIKINKINDITIGGGILLIYCKKKEFAYPTDNILQIELKHE